MRYLIAVATYNEIENVAELIQEIHHYAPGISVLFVDDNSPDGTGTLLEKIQLSDPLLKIVHRKGKLGLGTAHLAMMDYSIEQGFDALITMDSDFSHHPKYLPTMMQNLEENSFVIGSRYIKGGGTSHGPYRHLISITANFLTKVLLKIPLKECTTAYRGYHLELLQKFRKIPIMSNGYSFFVESLYRIHQLGVSMKEFPIIFEDRTSGKSKINKKEIFYGMLTLLRLFKQRIFDGN